MYDVFQAEMDSLTATKEKLKNGQRKLEDIINQLESETVCNALRSISPHVCHVYRLL